ncbi:MAG: hypothetical protein ACRDXX_17135 [Stackebrandtia sp.]
MDVKPTLNRRRLLMAAGLGTAAAATWGLTAGAGFGPEDDAELYELDVLAAGFPRVIFFRRTEVAGCDPDYPDHCNDPGDEGYEPWKAQFARFNGIEGKLLDEELHRVRPWSTERIQQYFRQFKSDYPNKLALLHFNGKGRRPQFAAERYSARHWLYYTGTMVTEKAPKTDEITTLKVADSSVFAMYREDPDIADLMMPDDIAVVPYDAETDTLLWNNAEHVRLESVDDDTSITVRRNFYGFERGPVEIPERSFIAPHTRIQPPIVEDYEEALWLYNFSPDAADPDGRTCADELAAELAEYFADDGPLAGLDGLQFDVQFFTVKGKSAEPKVGFCVQEHLIDVDNDGDADEGFVDGVNAYGLGMVEFGRKLRDRMDGKLLLADGMHPEVHQRNFDSYNGMESEGFPVHRDNKIGDWSGAMNQHRFWASRVGEDSHFSYIVHKYITGNVIGVDDFAYAKARLVAAASAIAGVTFALGSDEYTPPPVKDDENNAWVRVFDELWRGKDQEPNWLGQPRGEARHLGAEADDLLEGNGLDWNDDYIKDIQGKDATVERVDGSLRVSWDADAEPASHNGDTGAAFRTVTIPVTNPHPGDEDLFVELSLSGDPVEGYPETIARRVRLRAYVGDVELPVGEGKAARYAVTWVDDKAFTARFLFRSAEAGEVTLVLAAEGDADVTLHRLTVHAATDTVFRRFQGGVVLANPSDRKREFDLSQLTYGDFRRIDGNEEQKDEGDYWVNDGTDVENPIVELQPYDGLFLVDKNWP